MLEILVLVSQEILQILENIYANFKIFKDRRTKILLEEGVLAILVLGSWFLGSTEISAKILQFPYFPGTKNQEPRFLEKNCLEILVFGS